MARASSRLAKGPICTWSRLSLGSLRTTALYPRFFKAPTRISASSGREMAATWTMEGVPAVAATGWGDAGAVELGVEAVMGFGGDGSESATETEGVGLRGVVTGLSSGSAVSCLTRVVVGFEDEAVSESAGVMGSRASGPGV